MIYSHCHSNQGDSNQYFDKYATFIQSTSSEITNRTSRILRTQVLYQPSLYPVPYWSANFCGSTPLSLAALPRMSTRSRDSCCTVASDICPSHWSAPRPAVTCLAKVRSP